MKSLRFILLILFVALSACQTSESEVATNAPKICEQINPSKLSMQVDFHSIFPGKTVATEIRNLLGEPKEISTYNDIEVWIYQGFQITVRANVATSLTMNRTSSEMLTLGELIETYGCPDSMYAFAPYEDVPPEDDTYSVAALIYSSIGLEIDTPFPTSLDDLPTAVMYIPPASLESLISDIRFPKTQIIWDELIQPTNEVP